MSISVCKVSFSFSYSSNPNSNPSASELLDSQGGTLDDRTESAVDSYAYMYSMGRELSGRV